MKYLLILLGALVHQTNIESIESPIACKVEKIFVVGLSIVTSNETFQTEGVPLWGRFFTDNIAEKIPGRVNSDLLAVYTNYQGDFTKPFTYILGCEVANLNQIPEGMVGLEIDEATYSLYTAKGEFPGSMLETWRAIWTSTNRAYTTDFEVYPSDFNPAANPEIKIFIATTD